MAVLDAPVDAPVSLPYFQSSILPIFRSSRRTQNPRPRAVLQAGPIADTFAAAAPPARFAKATQVKGLRRPRRRRPGETHSLYVPQVGRALRASRKQRTHKSPQSVLPSIAEDQGERHQLLQVSWIRQLSARVLNRELRETRTGTKNSQFPSRLTNLCLDRYRRRRLQSADKQLLQE